MKQFYFVFAIIVLAFVVTPTVSKAQSIIDTAAATEIGASLDSSSGPTPSNMSNKIQERLRRDLESRAKSLEDRSGQDSVKDIMERRVASSTPTMIRDQKQGRGIDNASTSRDLEERLSSVMTYRRGMMNARLDLFKHRQDNLVKQLNRALENLKQISVRLESRIEKVATSSRDMTVAKGLLIIAKEKMGIAERAIEKLASYSPSTSTVQTISTSSAPLTWNVNLDKPRQIGSEAIRAVNDARKALNDVVIAIAKAMGFRFGQERRENSSSTPPVACPADARMCPDGSTVGRTGPRCEFSACPTATTTATTTATSTL